jgi:hypothetical protein
MSDTHASHTASCVALQLDALYLPVGHAEQFRQVVGAGEYCVGKHADEALQRRKRKTVDFIAALHNAVLLNTFELL